MAQNNHTDSSLAGRAGEILLEIKNVTKTFGPVTALRNVSFMVRRGEIHGLIGENGSGKSTVTTIFCAVQKADSGSMTFKGQDWKPVSMLDALAQGAGIIMQETGTVPGITVAENMFLGETKQFSRFGIVNNAAMYRAADKILDEMGISNIRAEMITGTLNLQDRKLVEIAKVYMKHPEVIVVDETSTALSQQGREILYRLVERMSNENKAVIFISHDLDEIMEVCNSITVLRDGDIIRTFSKKEFEPDAIRTSMIGREMKGDYYRGDYDGSFENEVVLEARDVFIEDLFENLNIQLHKGEILGIGGLSDCGMHELGKLLFGAVKPDRGDVIVYGRNHAGNPGEAEILKDEAFAMSRKIGYVAKDRDVESLCLTASIKDNISIGGLDQFSSCNGMVVLSGNEKKYVNRQVQDLKIKCFDVSQEVSQLSGGNKQKVVFGKWVGRGSQILILDCPTRGIDIGVKQSMYQLMYQFKKEGRSIIMISEELAELIGMADRILIMKKGKISGEISRSEDLTDAKLINYMI